MKKSIFLRSIISIVFFLGIFFFSSQEGIPNLYAEKIITTQGTIYKPDEQGVYPGIVLLHGVNGLNPAQHEIGLALSRQRYVALVIDYYKQNDLEYSFARWHRFQGIVDNSVKYLQTLTYVNKKSIGLMGFSQGAILAVTTTAGNKDIKAVIDFYGPNPEGGWFLESVHARKKSDNPYFKNKSVKDLPPIQIHHGSRDSIAAVRESRDLYQLLQKEGKPAEIYIYEGLDHAFNYRSYSGWYNEAADRISLQRSIKFLDKYLKK